MHKHVLGHHPLDVVGWDGYLYPWVFNVEDFEPITGRIHQPPQYIKRSKVTISLFVLSYHVYMTIIQNLFRHRIIIVT